MWLPFRKKTGQQKQLEAPRPELYACGLCNEQVPKEGLLDHWTGHSAVVAQSQKPDESPFRAAKAPETMIFIIRRPGLLRGQTEMEKLLSEFFSKAILELRKNFPEWRFQFLPYAMGETTQFLKSLLVIAERDPYPR